MSILEIECIEELLRFLLVEFLQRFLHRERRARIFRHGISEHFRISAMNGENSDFRSVRSAIAGHGVGGYSLRFGHQASNRNRLALYRAMTANSGAKMSVEISGGIRC